jgi:hypothetical protein
MRKLHILSVVFTQNFIQATSILKTAVRRNIRILYRPYTMWYVSKFKQIKQWNILL